MVPLRYTEPTFDQWVTNNNTHKMPPKRKANYMDHRYKRINTPLFPLSKVAFKGVQ